MSIYNLQFATYEQTFKVKEEDRKKYGEIYTPFSLIEQMLDTFDPHVFADPTKRWLDIGAGRGYFAMKIFERLNTGLTAKLPDEMERKRHIITHMLFMVEVKNDNVQALIAMFGATANIYHVDFCGYGIPACLHDMDIIVGNPPYNANGIKKVPTEKTLDKKDDGSTIWRDFIHKSLALLKPDTGQLCLIVPSIWLKPDRYGIHQKLTQYKIEKINCFSGNETNKLFKGSAQTPTCFFLLTNCAKTANHRIQVYDKDRQTYVPLLHKAGMPIPLFGQYIINHLQTWIEMPGVGSLQVVKTNMPGVKTTFTESLYVATHPFMNIRTCTLEGTMPTLMLNYSDTPQAFSGVKKIVMAHKMYGFPYFDKYGHFGISNRDNYVIVGKTDAEFEQLQRFLSTKLVLYIFEAARYRMKCLEKHAFQFIPDITRLAGFPSAHAITDASVAAFFGLAENDVHYITRLHKKAYKSF